MNQYKGILFDVGGTLLNGEPSEEVMLFEKFKQLGIQVTYNQVLNAFYLADSWVLEHSLNNNEIKHRFPLQRVGAGIEKLIFEQLCIICGLDESIKIHERYQRLPLVPRKWILIEPEIHLTLEKLIAFGYRLGVVSNWRPGLEEVLASVGLRKYFEVIVSSSSFGFEKPNPEIILHACAKMGLKSTRCIYIGDFAADAACARLAGMDVALIGKALNPLMEEFGINAHYSLEKASNLLEILFAT